MVDLESDIAVNVFHARTWHGAKLSTIGVAMRIVGSTMYMIVDKKDTWKAEAFIFSTQNTDSAMSGSCIHVTVFSRREFLHPYVATQNEIFSTIKGT